jgi:pyridinium-3,5-biscarboxylic acid mononucleotide sulfurtransferase
MNTDAKYDRLKEIIGRLDSVLVAYSGGVDSTLLLKAAVDAVGGEHVLAFIGTGPIFSHKETQESRQTAEKIGADCVMADTMILKVPLFVENTKERCYHCKKNLLSLSWVLAREKGLACVAEGTNYDDLDDYRPGNKACKEMGVVSPLLEANLTKQDIRLLSKRLNLPTRDKPSNACLATRIPYGTAINAALLKKIELSEEFIKSTGISQVRVRCHGPIARIEVPEGEFETLLWEREGIVEGLKRYGFIYVSLDIEGYRMGSMNEV